MCENIDIGTETWRVIVLRRNASELLVFEDREGFSLPRVDIPQKTRVAHALNARIKSAWSLDVFALCPLPSSIPSLGNHFRCHVVEAIQHDAAPPQAAQWHLVSSLHGMCFTEPDADAIREWRAMTAFNGPNSDHPPFGKPGCLARLRAWAQDALQPLGLRLEKQFVQFTASASFSLIRFETNKCPVWLKAVGEPSLHELPISRELARLVPTFVPSILAVRDDWNSWLTRNVEGTHPDENSGVDIWTNIAATLANLQTASIGNTLHFIDAGCRDIRIPALTASVEPFFQTMSDLMATQTKELPAPMSRTDIHILKAIVFEALAQLGRVSVPNSLGHLDFNPGNILVGSDRVIFLDWAAACVGCPLITLEYLLERLRRIHRSPERWIAEVRSAYLNRWRPFVEPDELASAGKTTPLVAVFAYAVGSGAWRDPKRLRDPDTAAHLRGLTRRMNREAAGWLESVGSMSAGAKTGVTYASRV
jgi:hypothetical protein